MMRAWIAGQPPILELRKQRGLTRDVVVDRLLALLGLRDERRDEGARLLPRAGERACSSPEASIDGSGRRSARCSARASATWRAGARAGSRRSRLSGCARSALDRHDAVLSAQSAPAPRAKRTKSIASSRVPVDNQRAWPTPTTSPARTSCASSTTPRSAETSCRYPSRRSPRTCSASRSRCATTCPSRGMLLPPERRILVRSDEPQPRRRFTIAHELGHWICQCLEGDMQPVYCRAAEIGVDAGRRRWSARRTSSRRTC